MREVIFMANAMCDSYSVPPDIIPHVWMYMGTRELISLSGRDKHWRVALREEKAWSIIMSRRYGVDVHREAEEDTVRSLIALMEASLITPTGPFYWTLKEMCKCLHIKIFVAPHVKGYTSATLDTRAKNTLRTLELLPISCLHAVARYMHRLLLKLQALSYSHPSPNVAVHHLLSTVSAENDLYTYPLPQYRKEILYFSELLDMVWQEKCKAVGTMKTCEPAGSHPMPRRDLYRLQAMQSPTSRPLPLRLNLYSPLIRRHVEERLLTPQ